MPGKRLSPTKPMPTTPSQPRMATRSVTSPKKPILALAGELDPSPVRKSGKGMPTRDLSDTSSLVEDANDDDDYLEDEELDEFGEEAAYDDLLTDDEDIPYADDDFDKESLSTGTSTPSGTLSTSSSLGPRKRAKDDEDAWLEALEEGRLHEVDDELKKMKDPKLMTARQRALLESKSQKKKQEVVRIQEIESAKKNRKQERMNMDEEAAERRMVKARKRRQQAEEKKEKDKKQTIDRLLKKMNDSSESKQPGSKSKRRKLLLDYPKMTYVNNRNGACLILPDSMNAATDLLRTSDRVVAKVKKEELCARESCGKRRKYCCASNGLACCSIECYRVLNVLDVRTTREINDTLDCSL